ncbi:hypothetical protein ILYODFUR_006018 [Ilyodon furcidens]|uniref:Uncharacterized protein n=1 Tax=Ilyodon furcidens TaxID=33524 RepID=A0ABV0SWT2_9TELE
MNTSSPCLPHDTPLPSHTRVGDVCVESSSMASSQYPSLPASLTPEQVAQSKPKPSLKPAGPEPDPGSISASMERLLPHRKAKNEDFHKMCSNMFGGVSALF